MSVPSAKNILNLLPPAQGNYEKVVNDQNVFDIVRHSLEMHNETAPDYDLISEKFWKGTPWKTCECIFDFCKNNIPYEMESPKIQTVKSPGQIVLHGVEGRVEQDCKHYALFCCGIIDSLRRKGYPIKCIYRFASDVQNERYPKHVFCVVQTDEGDIWCDPVLKTLNAYHKYYFFLNRKPKDMALYKVSGLGTMDNIDYVCGVFGATYVGAHKKEHKKHHIKLPHIKINPGRLLLAPALIPARNAFLALLKINAFNMAHKMFEHGQTPQGKADLQKIWKKAQGKWKNLAHNINQGNRVYLAHHHKKMLATEHTLSGTEANYVGVITLAAIAAMVATATPIIVMFKSLFHSLRVDTKKVDQASEMGVSVLAKEHNVSADGTHTDETETEVTTGPGGAQMLHVKSHRGNTEEQHEGAELETPQMQQRSLPYSPGGGIESPMEHNNEMIEQDVHNKVLEGQTTKEIPFAKTGIEEATNVVTDWGKGFKNFVVNNKGVVITTLSIFGVIMISRSPLLTGKKRR